IQHPELDRVLNSTQFLDYFAIILFVNVRDHIAYRLIRLQILTNDIDVVVGKHLVDLGENSGDVVVNMSQAMCIFENRKRKIREVYAIRSAACIDVINDLSGYKVTNVLLCFLSTSSNVRC